MGSVFVRFAKIKNNNSNIDFFQIFAEFSNLVEPMDDPHGTLRVHHGIYSRAVFPKVRSVDHFWSTRFSILVRMKKNNLPKRVSF